MWLWVCVCGPIRESSGLPISNSESGFRGVGSVVDLRAIKESWVVLTSHCDSGFRGLGVVAGL